MITKKHRRDAHPVNAEINLTNLIDIAFVLLIIFMITAPIMQGGVNLTLPKGDVTPMESSDVIIVSLTSDGKVWIDKTEVTMDDLGVQMQRYASSNKTVAFRADTNVPYGQASRAISVMNKAGITNVGLMMEPEQAH